jgi:collagen type IV alpha-3-binding protein
LQEGPHSALNDEEFYDAVETGLDRMDEELELHDRLKTKQQQQQIIAGPCKVPSKACQHRLWPEVMFYTDCLNGHCHFLE